MAGTKQALAAPAQGAVMKGRRQLSAHSRRERAYEVWMETFGHAMSVEQERKARRAARDAWNREHPRAWARATRRAK